MDEDHPEVTGRQLSLLDLAYLGQISQVPVLRRLVPNLRYALERELEGCRIILDLGCGPRPAARLIFPRATLVGVDAFRPNLLEATKARMVDHALLADVSRPPFKDDRFDAVLALDVIEHIPKEAGFRLIASMRSLARKRVVLLTPNGYVPQESSNPLNRHVSGWTVSELRSLGFLVYGIGGWKPLRVEFARCAGPFPRVMAVASAMTQGTIFKRPENAYHLLAVARINAS